MDEKFGSMHSGLRIGTYAKNEQEHPLTMAKAGFHNISTDYITLNLTPDNDCYPSELSRRMIESDRQCALDAVSFIEEKAADLVSAEEISEIKNSICSRYEKRFSLLS